MYFLFRHGKFFGKIAFYSALICFFMTDVLPFFGINFHLLTTEHIYDIKYSVNKFKKSQAGGDILLSTEELDRYCREFYSPIFRYCMYFLTNKEDAEDVTQETFLIFSNKGQLLEERHIGTWLYKTAHNLILREYQKRRTKTDKETALEDKALELSHKYISFEENMISYYLPRHLKEIHSLLPDKDKKLFELCLDGTKKTAQIAQILGIEPHACSMRKKRLRIKCEEIMYKILFY